MKTVRVIALSYCKSDLSLIEIFVVQFIRLGSLNLSSSASYKNEQSFDGKEKKKGFFSKMIFNRVDKKSSEYPSNESVQSEYIDCGTSRSWKVTDESQYCPNHSISLLDAKYFKSHRETQVIDHAFNSPHFYDNPGRRSYVGGYAAAAYEAARHHYILTQRASFKTDNVDRK